MEGSEKPDDILSILSDEQSRRIITLLGEKELTVQQVANLLEMPASTTYRKVRALENLKIVKKSKVMRNLDGSDESYYKSWVIQITITFRDGEMSYHLERAKMEDKIVRLWQKFKE